jgi:hypothetical protein
MTPPILTKRQYPLRLKTTKRHKDIIKFLKQQGLLLPHQKKKENVSKTNLFWDSESSKSESHTQKYP